MIGIVFFIPMLIPVEHIVRIAIIVVLLHAAINEAYFLDLLYTMETMFSYCYSVSVFSCVSGLMTAPFIHSDYCFLATNFKFWLDDFLCYRSLSCFSAFLLCVHNRHSRLPDAVLRNVRACVICLFCRK